MWMENTCKDLEPWIDSLNERVPMQGKCKGFSGKNKSLDRFRRAQNVVHDIFNNGVRCRLAHMPSELTAVLQKPWSVCHLVLELTRLPMMRLVWPLLTKWKAKSAA